VEKKEIAINPKAPDDHWVSPSGSDCWCTVGQLKNLISELCRLSNENVRLNAMVTYDCREPGVYPDLAEVERLTALPVAWQLCPKCQGQGAVAYPPNYPAGCAPMSSQTTWVCDICHGVKVLATRSAETVRP